MALSLDSFNTRATLQSGGKTYAYYSLPKLAEGRFPGVATMPYSLRILLENLMRGEDGVTVTSSDVAALASYDAKNVGDDEIAFRPARVLMQDLTGVPGDRRPRGDARRDGRPRRRPTKINPLQPAELVIDHSVQVDEYGSSPGLRAQRRPGAGAQPRALRPPALGPAGARQLQGRAAGHRHRAPGQPGVPGPRRLHGRGRRRRADGLPRHRHRHRLPHDDDQRPRRARLGRRRHRGGGVAARPAEPDAHPGGRRLPAHRQAARRRHGDRPRADRDADAATPGASSASSSSSSAPASTTCRCPTARRSPTWRPSTAPRPATSRSTPRR